MQIAEQHKMSYYTLMKGENTEKLFLNSQHFQILSFSFFHLNNTMSQKIDVEFLWVYLF